MNKESHNTSMKLENDADFLLSDGNEEMELLSRIRAQEDDIIVLHEQIVLACERELQLLDEKYVLERKFSDLRMVVGEKKFEAITSTLNELEQRKNFIEENLKLTRDLKVVDDDTYIFTSSMLRLLAEFEVRPYPINASSICHHVKLLHDKLKHQIKSSHVTGPNAKFSFDKGASDSRALELNKELIHPSNMHDMVTSVYDEGPGIEGFQIYGDAVPGERLLGCGYPTHGTSLCMFQWVRHLEDTTKLSIDGATNPEYVVTADDVDKLISVECIPMDDHGRQGEPVILFANDHKKIKCDPYMQLEIDSYISKRGASFSILLLTDSSENWFPMTFLLTQLTCQIKDIGSNTIVLEEKYSNDLSIKLPIGLSAQFVLTCSSRSFSLSAHDARTRDSLVLTMRMLQRKALDEANVMA